MRLQQTQYPSFSDVVLAAKLVDRDRLVQYQNQNTIDVHEKKRKGVFVWTPTAELAWRNDRESCDLPLRVYKGVNTVGLAPRIFIIGKN